MNSGNPAEHFVTLFDSHYLPLGLSLYRSLEEHAQPFHLWIVAVDDACADALAKMNLPCATVVSLREVENDALRSVKAQRSVGEYCWTLTPFLPSFVFERSPQIERVTYLDADLFFFQSPGLLIDEFVESGKHVLITEHAFAPEYEHNLFLGRFCVQFLTFRRTDAGDRVLRWWQDRCIEWCYARAEDGKFGDQKYLDQWPSLFADEVHILTRTDRTLAPWNVAHFSRISGKAQPVFYHFHSLKIISSRTAVLHLMYRIGAENRWIYDRYLETVRRVIRQMSGLQIPVIGRRLLEGHVRSRRLAWYIFIRELLQGKADWARL